MIILFDTPLSRQALYPLSLTRPLCNLRMGILTIRQWWQAKTSQPVVALTEGYLNEPLPEAGAAICVDASVCATEECLQQILQLQPGQMLEDETGLIAYAVATLPAYNQLPLWIEQSFKADKQPRIDHPSFLFQHSEQAIRSHFSLVTAGKISAIPHASNTIIGEHNLFIEPGVQMLACIINASAGPVYIGENAQIMEGSIIRGPVSIGEGAVIKMGAKLYPGTTIGPYSTAGGEIKNAILTGYSNKAHDGYLGDAVIGEWCNLGAGTTNSNVKNTGGAVKMWNAPTNDYKAIGNKGGLVMGDYSRSAINTAFNTGTTVGICCNVFSGNFLDKHIESFNWGQYERYDFEKACADAANWKKMKGKEFSDLDRLILQHIYGKKRD